VVLAEMASNQPTRHRQEQVLETGLLDRLVLVAKARTLVRLTR